MKKGFTLTELLIALGILAVALTGLLSIYIAGNWLIESGRNTMTATKDAEAVFEYIKSLDLSNSAVRANLRNNRNNQTWWQNAIGNFTLSNETVNVSNLNSSDPSWNDNPLGLQVTVSWTERGRNRNVSLQTEFSY